MIRLLLKEIADTYVRKNFEKLSKFFVEQHILGCGFRHFAYRFTEAGTNIKIPHGLKYVPTDLIQTWKSGPGTITFNYDLFDATSVDVTVTDACVVRGFIGAYGRN